MIPITLKRKVLSKLNRNKKAQKNPQNICELSKELGFSRQVFYTKDFTPNAMTKLREWVEKNA